ncbi:MAG: hypothetical protein J3K34DRAFT_516762 [Monoraphidium minutum]|nr:MAG: hypothetical protein J3K34DRAFT_516762 [Monoraphidium minutum]
MASSFLAMLHITVLAEAMRTAFKRGAKAPAAAGRAKSKTAPLMALAASTTNETPATETPSPRRASSASDAPTTTAASAKDDSPAPAPGRSASLTAQRFKEAALKAAAGARAALDTATSPLTRALSRGSLLVRSVSSKKPTPGASPKMTSPFAALATQQPAGCRRSSSSTKDAASPPAGPSTASNTTALPQALTPEPALPSSNPFAAPSPAAADEECAVTVTLASAAEPKAKAKTNSLRNLFSRPAAAVPKSPATTTGTAAPKAKIALVAAQLKAALARRKGGEEGAAPAHKAGAAFGAKCREGGARLKVALRLGGSPAAVAAA